MMLIMTNRGADLFSFPLIGVSADIPTPWVSTESLQAADLNSTLSGSGLQLGHTLVNSRSMPSLNGSPMHSFAEADSSKKRKKPKDKKRQMFSQAATKILKEWLHGNLSVSLIAYV